MKIEIVGISVLSVMVIISKQPRDSPKLWDRQTSYGYINIFIYVYVSKDSEPYSTRMCRLIANLCLA